MIAIIEAEGEVQVEVIVVEIIRNLREGEDEVFIYKLEKRINENRQSCWVF